MQSLAILLILAVLVLAFLAGVFVARAWGLVSSLRKQVDELTFKVADAQYPRRRTHADNVRLEDLLAYAGDLRDEIEVTGLHMDQEHRQHAERLHQLRSIAASIFENLADARNARPTDFPAVPKPADGMKADLL